MVWLADADELALDELLGNNPGVGLHVGGARHAIGKAGHIGRAATEAQDTFLAKALGDGQQGRWVPNRQTGP